MECTNPGWMRVVCYDVCQMCRCAGTSRRSAQNTYINTVSNCGHIPTPTYTRDLVVGSYKYEQKTYDSREPVDAKGKRAPITDRVDIKRLHKKSMRHPFGFRKLRHASSIRAPPLVHKSTYPTRSSSSVYDQLTLVPEIRFLKDVSGLPGASVFDAYMPFSWFYRSVPPVHR